MTVVRVEPYVLREMPGRRVVEADGDRVQVARVDYEMRPGQTLEQFAYDYAALRDLTVVIVP